MKSKLFSIPSVGEVMVCKHHNSKRLSIKLAPGQLPKVVIPKLMTYTMGFQFAVEKKDWIIEHTQILSQKRNPVNLFSEDSVFPTRFHTIAFARHKITNIVSKKSNNQIIVYFPESVVFESDENQKLIRGFISQVLRNEAKEYLPQRIKLLAERFGFSYKQVFVKNLKTRWGSCSAVNNINLNIQLMRLPEHLSDFIILHELCHTVHKNHGSHFHAMLNKLCGDEKGLNKELRKFSTQF
jgi:predicted metal-dependent hydrolase